MLLFFTTYIQDVEDNANDINVKKCGKEGYTF